MVLALPRGGRPPPRRLHVIAPPRAREATPLADGAPPPCPRPRRRVPTPREAEERPLIARDGRVLETAVEAVAAPPLRPLREALLVLLLIRVRVTVAEADTPITAETPPWPLPQKARTRLPGGAGDGVAPLPLPRP